MECLRWSLINSPLLDLLRWDLHSWFSGRECRWPGGQREGGLQLPPLKSSLHSHCFPVQLYQIEFQCELGPEIPTFYPGLRHKLLSNTAFGAAGTSQALRASGFGVGLGAAAPASPGEGRERLWWSQVSSPQGIVPFLGASFLSPASPVADLGSSLSSISPELPHLT